MPETMWRPWILLAAFSIVALLVNASTYFALGVILPSMVKDLGWNWAEAGLGFTLLGVATGASSLLPAFLIRRFGVRFTLLVGSVVMAAAFFLLSETIRPPLYFLATGLCGIGYQMMTFIPGTYVLGAIFKRRSFPFGIYFTTAALGGVAGPWIVLAALRLSDGKWREFWVFQLVVILLVGAICAALVGKREWLAKVSTRTDLEVATDLSRKDRAGVYRTAVDWTVRQALRSPQFYVLLAAYFGHLLIGISVVSLSVAQLNGRGVALVVAGAMLSLESIAQVSGRAISGLIGDFVDPRRILIFALAALAIGAGSLSIAHDYLTMIIFAIGSGLGFGMAALSVTMLLLNYYGRRHNLELFSLTGQVGAISALGPVIGGLIRDRTGNFELTFQIYTAIIVLVLMGAIFMRPPRLRYDRS